MKRLLPFALALAALAVLPAAAHACPGCAQSVTVAPGQAPAGEVLAGFSWSVLFLLGAVLSAISGLGALIVRACQRIERERSQS